MNSDLEIVEIIKPAQQGMTTPFLCNASDGAAYYVKGKTATIAGLIKEWLGCHLANAFGLPLPVFDVAYLDPILVSAYNGAEASQLNSGTVFVSKQISSVTELKYQTIQSIDLSLQLDVLLFDLWVENEDRTLSETGGNPNLLWKSDHSGLYVIDHNLIFENAFNINEFWKTHAFRQALQEQVDIVERLGYESRMQKALACWEQAWDKLPDEWVEINDELEFFDPDKHYQRLKREAEGDIWLKLP
jgi:hypothetical protein